MGIGDFRPGEESILTIQLSKTKNVHIYTIKVGIVS